MQDVIDSLACLPGVGPKGAARIAFYLLNEPSVTIDNLVNVLSALRDRARFCVLCGNVSTDEYCKICQDPGRDRSQVCVVEEVRDVQAVERTKEYNGLYHVLGGSLNPLAGVGPDDLNIRTLLQRLAHQHFPDAELVPPVSEIILATDPNTEGEATATYLVRTLQVFPDLKVTRLASGLPMGGDLEFADELTLSRALIGRRNML